MKASQILQDNGLTPVTYADVCFDNVLGTCSKETGDKRLYMAISITMEDNDLDMNTSNLETLVINFEDMKEIALSCNILYTDMAMCVHSASFKSEPFKSLKIVRIK